MTQEDKNLLLKDLSARLPYDVKVSCNDKVYNFNGIQYFNICILTDDNENNAFTTAGIKYIKPYLFPLTNLTEEQRNDVSKLLINTQDEFPPYGKINMVGCDNLFISTVKQANALIKYCITHHFDINGLIPMGLAIDATGLNIY